MDSAGDEIEHNPIDADSIDTAATNKNIEEEERQTVLDVVHKKKGGDSLNEDKAEVEDAILEENEMSEEEQVGARRSLIPTHDA